MGSCLPIKIDSSYWNVRFGAATATTVTNIFRSDREWSRVGSTERAAHTTYSTITGFTEERRGSATISQPRSRSRKKREAARGAEHRLLWEMVVPMKPPPLTARAAVPGLACV